MVRSELELGLPVVLLEHIQGRVKGGGGGG